MCRLAAYLGSPVPLGRIIVEPAHSLLEQSQHAAEAKLAVNGDGFGFAWYDDGPEPGLYRDVLPAWSDGNLPSLCRMIRSRLFLAHVRASTTGETSRVNCHPFVQDGWSFMHNGQVGDFTRIRRALEGTLSDPLYMARRGSTDSELLFLMLLNCGLKDDPHAATMTMLNVLRAHSAYGTGKDAVRLTCVFSDGQTIYAFRHASDERCPTLYVRAIDGGGWTLASEPLDGVAANWAEVPADTLLTLAPGRQTHRPLAIGDGSGRPAAA